MGIGIVWETYHKGVPFLGVPENTLDSIIPAFPTRLSKSSSLTSKPGKAFETSGPVQNEGQIEVKPLCGK